MLSLETFIINDLELMYRLVVIIIVWCAAVVGRFDCRAQEIDTLINNTGDDRLSEMRLSTSGYENLVRSRVEKMDYDLNIGQGRRTLMYNNFGSKKRNDDFDLNLSQGIGPVLKWQGGMATVDRESVDYPGMMGEEFAGFNVYQNVGRFMFGAHADVIRYGYFHGVSNQYGGGASVGYRVSDNVSVIVFGSVYSQAKGHGIDPAMMGFMPSSGYGGVIDIEVGNVGVMAGVRRDYVPIRGRWELRPVIAPYWSLGNQKFSVDLGSIIGNFLSHALGPDSDIIRPGVSNRSFPSVGRPGYIPPHRR